MPKPQASCTITVDRGHGGQDAADVAGRRQGAAGRDGAAAHQPPARLPGLRQGRRVPAAEPGDEQRPRHVPVRGRQAHLPQADQHLHPGAARPRALRAVRPLHPLLRPDRRRPVHRARRARRAAAGRHLRGPAVRVLLLRQHRADLPGRRADRRGLPVPRRARSTWCRPRASASTAPPAARSAPTTAAARCCAGWPTNDPAVNEEWNCDKGRWAFPYATPADRIELPDGARRATASCGSRSWPEALRRRGRGPRTAAKGVGVLVGGRVSVEDAYAYGKFARVVLRTNDIDFRARPHSAEEADFLARTVVATGPDGGAVTYADLEDAKTVVLVGFEPEEERPIVFLRLRKGVRRHQDARVCRRALRDARPRPSWTARCIPTAPGTEAEVLRALGGSQGRRSCQALRGAPGAGRDRPRRRAPRHRARRPVGGRRPRREPPAPGWRGCPRRAGERGALEAGALADAAARRPSGRRRPGPHRGRRGLGRRRAARRTRPRHCRHPRGGRRPASIDALVIGGVDPADLADARRRGGPGQDLRRLARDPASVGDRGRRRRASRGAARREGRHVRRLGGPGPRTFEAALDSSALSPTTASWTCWPPRWVPSSAPARWPRSVAR